MYAYCENNPVGLADVTGTCPYDGTAADFRRLEQGLPPIKCKCSNFTLQIETTNNSKIDDSKPPDHPDYKPPKKWDGKKVRNPNGNNKGWPAADGGVWIHTPEMHGGEEWTIQYPKGDHSHAYPGGGVRNHFEVEQSVGKSSVMLIGGTIFSLILLADNAFGVGIADDPMLAFSGGMIASGVSGLSGKRVCTVCGEIKYEN